MKYFDYAILFNLRIDEVRNKIRTTLLIYIMMIIFAVFFSFVFFTLFLFNDLIFAYNFFFQKIENVVFIEKNFVCHDDDKKKTVTAHLRCE